MSKVRASLGWLLAAVVTAACSLNPQVDPPSALTENGMDGSSGTPIFSGGGQGGRAISSGGANQGAGGTSQGGAPGAGGAAQGGYSGAFDMDASTPPDGAAPIEAGTDGHVDGGTNADGSTAKDARTD